MPIRFQYPEVGWSTGKMRKYGEKPDNGNGNDATVTQVMDVRRGRPELEEPGIAEAEKLAGAGISARGGADLGRAGRMAQTRAEVIKGAGGISPETIAQHKTELQRLVADQLVSGNVDFRRINKWAKDRNWTSVFDVIDPTGEARPIAEMTAMATPTIGQKWADLVERMGVNKAQADKARERFQGIQENMDKAPAGTQMQKLLWALKQQKKVPFIDPQGNVQDISTEKTDGE